VSEVWPGRPFPLGAEWDGEVTNFSLFSEGAEQVELCLFDEEGQETRIEMTERTAPSIALAYGSISSFAGLKRRPAVGSYGPCTR
jgi:pullulanase/glycogen debranching enzyme